MISLHDCGDHRRWLAHSSSFKHLSLSQSRMLCSRSAHLEEGQSVASYLDSFFTLFHLPPQALPTPLWPWTFTAERSIESQAKKESQRQEDGSNILMSENCPIPTRQKGLKLSLALLDSSAGCSGHVAAIHISSSSLLLFYCHEEIPGPSPLTKIAFNLGSLTISES